MSPIFLETIFHTELYCNSCVLENVSTLFYKILLFVSLGSSRPVQSKADSKRFIIWEKAFVADIMLTIYELLAKICVNNKTLTTIYVNLHNLYKESKHISYRTRSACGYCVKNRTDVITIGELQRASEYIITTKKR